MNYWPEEDRPKKDPGPFDAVFADAKEGALTWPVRDRYGLAEIKGPTKILPAGWPELVRRSPKGAELLLWRADKLMACEGLDVTRRWLLVSDDPDNDAAPSPRTG